MLETERLVLRPWSLDDSRGFARLAEDPQVMRTIGTGETWPEARRLAWLQKQTTRFDTLGYSFLAVIERTSGEVAGICGVQQLGDKGLREIGWWVRSDRWGRGYATEAALAARDWAFGALDIDRLDAIAVPGNSGSTHIMRKLGMHLVGECEYTDLGGDVPGIPVVHYMMLRPSC
ncbi:MAG: ribosomal-protein-alanine N-acetyltransferase [Chlamydiales bacterium]|jgi:ribosomal-protein-alanine N-acetyltransferase